MALAVAPFEARAEEDPFAQMEPVSDDTLRSMRGGTRIGPIPLDIGMLVEVTIEGIEVETIVSGPDGMITPDVVVNGTQTVLQFGPQTRVVNDTAAGLVSVLENSRDSLTITRNAVLDLDIASTGLAESLLSAQRVVPDMIRQLSQFPF